MEDAIEVGAAISSMDCERLLRLNRPSSRPMESIWQLTIQHSQGPGLGLHLEKPKVRPNMTFLSRIKNAGKLAFSLPEQLLQFLGRCGPLPNLVRNNLYGKTTNPKAQ